MITAAWVRRQRVRLVLLSVVRALAWAAATLFVGLTIGVVAASTEVRVAAWIVAFALLAALLWRDRFTVSLRRVALWFEERRPELRYALITALDPRYAAAFGPRVEPLLRRLDTRSVMRRSALRSTVVPVIAVVLSVAVFAMTPGTRLRVSQPEAHAATPAMADPINRLDTLSATITPPRYALDAGVEPETLDEPTTISGLAGSTVEIVGRGSPEGLGARVGDSLLVAAPVERDADQNGWRVTFAVSDSAAALRLEDSGHHRLIVIVPVHDRPPTVQLVSPKRDTTVRQPAGSITLDARLTDDIALADAHFEYIVASGESEGSFTHREGVLGARPVDDPARQQVRLELEVPLSMFELGPGDVLSLRAIALDNNEWSGPGIGYSEPRVLRVARPAEYDSLAIAPAPPQVDSAQMTLRWLIELVERLDASRGDLPREVFVDSSRTFGAHAGALRIRVQQLRRDQTMGGVFAPDPLLDIANDALAQGETGLEIAEPDNALPHLWEAQEALQEYRTAARYYLRAVASAALVDVARVRLTGADTGQAAPRVPRSVSDTTRARLRSAFADALAWLVVSPDSARERLALLQVEALRHEPMLADMLADAVSALQRGRDPAPSLRRARRLLDGPARVTDTLPAWGGAW